jgi:hypothetical protein
MEDLIDGVITDAIADYNRLTRKTTDKDSTMKYVTYSTKEDADRDAAALEELGLICTPPTQVDVVSKDGIQVIQAWLVVAFRREEFSSPWSWQDTN